MSKSLRYLASVVVLFFCCASVQAQVAVGGEQLVSSDGETPSISVDARGSFTLVWADKVPNDWGIFGQVFPTGRETGGPQFLVNEDASRLGLKTQPKVAAGSDGRFITVWEDGFAFSSPDQPGGDGYGTGVFGRIFRAGGVPQGSQVSLSSSIQRHQLTPAVAMDKQQGSFVAAWLEALDELGEGSVIVASRFSSSGSPEGPELRMRTGDIPIRPKVAMSSQSFAVGWTEYVFCSPVDPQAVSAIAHFDSQGRPLGKIFRLPASACGESEGSMLTALAGSRAGFLAVFVHISRVSGSYSAQRFSPTGEPVGDRFTIPGRFSGAATEWNDLLTDVAMDDRGRFVITWETVRTTVETERFLSAQVFSIRNKPLRKAFTVGAKVGGSAVSLANDGTLMVAWREYRTGLKVRRYRLQ